MFSHHIRMYLGILGMSVHLATHVQHRDSVLNWPSTALTSTYLVFRVKPQHAVAERTFSNLHLAHLLIIVEQEVQSQCRTVRTPNHTPKTQPSLLCLKKQTSRSNNAGKRNTSRPVFTSHERLLAKSSWTSSSARLNRDSFLRFGSCSLCLESAVDPVACPDGDIFCRECALNNILAQKKEIKRLERAREHEEREAAEQRARQDEEAQARAVKEFELTQAGFDVARSRGGAGDESDGRGMAPVVPAAHGARSGEKRKFALDEDEVTRNAEGDRAKARRAIEDEKKAKPTLPSFWVPSVTPISNAKDKLHEVRKKAKTSPVCPSSQENRPHAYSLHTLVTINFTEEESRDAKTKSRICPSCKKGLTNSSKAVLTKPCGHVLCKACAGQFMKPVGHDPHADPQDAHEANTVLCYVCDGDVTERPGKKGSEKKEKEKIRPGVVELKSDGTGFSAGGTNEVKRSGTAFQC